MKKIWKIRVWKKILVWVLCLVVTLQSIPLYAQEQNKEVEKLEEERKKDSNSTQQSQEENLSDKQSKEEKAIDVSHIYEEGIIKIYNEKQLQAIGTGKPVKNNDNKEKQFGTGETVVVDKKEVIYGLDSKYQLMKDTVTG